MTWPYRSLQTRNRTEVNLAGVDHPGLFARQLLSPVCVLAVCRIHLSAGKANIQPTRVDQRRYTPWFLDTLGYSRQRHFHRLLDEVDET